MRRNTAGRLRFVDIATPGFDAAALGVRQADLMALLHVQDPAGRWLIGVPAVQAIYAEVGPRWLARALLSPLVLRLATPAYAWLARHRYHLPRWLSAVAHLHAGSCRLEGACRSH